MVNKESFLVDSLKSCRKLVIGIDPGETTGICAFKGSDLLCAEQIKRGSIYEDMNTIHGWIIDQMDIADSVPIIVYEEYRVYSWKTQDHAWADLYTPRLIGALEFLCGCNNWPIFKQTPQMAKQFCTDDKLKAWKVWQSGKRHANDSIRHACYFMLFNKSYKE